MPTPQEEYEARLTVLKEKKKMHMITQDQYDQQHAALVEELFPTPPPEEE